MQENRSATAQKAPRVHGVSAHAIEILQAHQPMTARQLYYQLVGRQAIENTLGRYKAICNLLVDARKDGTIPWEWIEDRLRRPRHVSMWRDLPDFAETACAAYRRESGQHNRHTLRLGCKTELESCSLASQINHLRLGKIVAV
jgi:hypothetical protein